MNCPNCGEILRERERSGIEIDVCPVCRGIWLDRGELDKLIDRESKYYESEGGPDRRSREPEYARQGGRGDYGDRDRGYDDREYRDRPPQKKEGFFQNLIETFGEGGEGMGD